jgi:hypothetical protein
MACQEQKIGVLRAMPCGMTNLFCRAGPYPLRAGGSSVRPLTLGSEAGEFPARFCPVNITSRQRVNTKQGLTVRNRHAYSLLSGFGTSRQDAGNWGVDLTTAPGREAGEKGQRDNV